MTDTEIIALFRARNEQAIKETAEKYNAYCSTIAFNILHDEETVAEVLNDTWLGAWNSIPPHEPENLAAYLGKIARNLSLAKWRDMHAGKRTADTISLAFDELGECLTDGRSAEKEVENAELGRLLARFVKELPETERKVFVCRYYYFDPVADIARRFDFSESKVKSMLLRSRKKLRKKLEKEGFTL